MKKVNKSAIKMVKAPDPRVTRKKKGTSKSIGPQESPKAIEAKRAKVRKLSGTFSKEEEKAVSDLK